MIDTVTLRIPVVKANLIRPDMFQNDVDATYGTNWHKWNKDNPHKGEYFPQVRIVQYSGYKGLVFELEVSFSGPKLLYGNNLLELQNKDFPSVCQNLKDKLKVMGIDVDLSSIFGAKVYKVHYGKNLICHGVPLWLVFKRLAVSRPPCKQMDVSKVTFTNGQQVTFHGKTFEVCFYDKYQELVKKQQRNLPDKFFRCEYLKNILRLEVRYNNREKVKELLGKNNAIFKTAFNDKTARKVLLQYWQKVYKSIQSMPYECFTPEYVFMMLAPKGTTITRLAWLGLYYLVGSVGYNAAHAMLHIEKKMESSLARLFVLLIPKEDPLIPREYDFLKQIDKKLRSSRWLTLNSLRKPQKNFQQDCPFIYERLLTIKEAAKYLKVRERTLQNHAKAGTLKAFRFGSDYRLSMKHIIEAICSTLKP